MGDESLPVTGKDVKIELLFNGFPQKLIDAVTNFTAEARSQDVETRHLGTTDVDVEQIPDGWAGEIEISRKSRQLDDFIDQYRFARANRIPTLILISVVTHFRDGTSVPHVYQDVKINFSGASRRGENVTARLTWRSGKERI